MLDGPPMGVVRRLAAPCAFVLLAACAGAPASRADGDPGDARVEAPSAPASGPDAAAPDCTGAVAVLREATSCVDVEAGGGVWRASVGVSSWNSALCSFRWEPASGGSAAPEESALEALGTDALAIESSCRDLAATAPEVALAAREDPPDMSHGGMHGCDVCGRLRQDRRGWAVFPPEKAPFKHVSVRLDDGRERWFEVVGERPVGVVSFVLPPPPAGRAWLPGTLSTL